MIRKIHKVRIETLDQFAKAIVILDEVGGTFQGVGSSSNRFLLLNDGQFNALVEARVIPTNETEKNKMARKGQQNYDN